MGKQTPEWSIFDRIDELETITLKLMDKTDVTEPSLKQTSIIARDAGTLALFGFVNTFRAYALLFKDVRNLRAIKDSWIANLKNVGLSQEMLELVESSLVIICESIEKS